MKSETAIIKKTFPVTGMSCASCAISAQTMIKAQKGVLDAGVNFANASAQIEFDPSVAHTEDFKKALQKIGYDLIIEDTAEAKHALDQQKQQDYSSLRLKTILSIAFSVPLVIIGMLFMDLPFANYIMWALATPVVLVFGKQFFVNAYNQARNGTANMDTLVALSTGVAYLFSVFNTVYPHYWMMRGMHAHVYFEAAAVVIAFILLGKLLEEKAKSNTSSAIKKLMGLQPNRVVRIAQDGSSQSVSLADVSVNDILLVKPGEKIPVDGSLISGSSYVDESMISGEPVPVLKEQDSSVFAGTINQQGSFNLRADKVGADTLLAHIIHMVQEAQGSKAPVQKLVDKIAGIFVPVVMAIALITLTGWIIFGGENGFTQGLLAMITVLVIACPCALGLATPTAIMVAVGKGAENGILIKDAESLELSHKINAIILDKTGTITEGKPEVMGIIWNSDIDNNLYSSILLGMESRSEHPLAGAIVGYLKLQKVSLISLDTFSSITGKGVEASVNSKKYYAGSRKMIAENGVSFPAELESKAEEWLKNASTVIWFSDDKRVIAAIAVADKIKASSALAIKQLADLNIEVFMLTGDNDATAKAVAAQAGIENYRSEMLPSDKAAFIKDLQAKGKLVAMVGDGINDSHALATADVSIAMGKGSDIAMDVAKMTLISSDLLQIPKAIKLSAQAVKIIKQNLFWAFIYNVIGIPIAAGILYPFTGFLLNPMIAGAAMALSSLSVVSNSLRLKAFKL